MMDGYKDRLKKFLEDQDKKDNVKPINKEAKKLLEAS